MIKQPKTGERQVRTLLTTEFRVATADDGTRTLSGLIPYNSPSCDLGGFTELLAPGVFAGALKAGADVLCLRDHIPANLLGRTKSKTLALTDSPEGLRFVCKLPKNSQGSDLAESVDRGDLDANSFGFSTIEDKWLCDAAGNVVRTLIAVDLYEISPCSFPAYPSSEVSIRSLASCPIEIRAKMKKRDTEKCDCDCTQCAGGDCGLCSDGDCDDENCSCAESRSIRNADANRVLNIRLAFTD
ncbi:MAG TPA: HK97 family phage prohead protease [Acidobacteriaceae bacterium]